MSPSNTNGVPGRPHPPLPSRLSAPHLQDVAGAFDFVSSLASSPAQREQLLRGHPRSGRLAASFACSASRGRGACERRLRWRLARPISPSKLLGNMSRRWPSCHLLLQGKEQWWGVCGSST